CTKSVTGEMRGSWSFDPMDTSPIEALVPNGRSSRLCCKFSAGAPGQTCPETMASQSLCPLLDPRRGEPESNEETRCRANIHAPDRGGDRSSSSFEPRRVSGV